MLVRNSSVAEMNFNKMLLQASMNTFQWPTQKNFMGEFIERIVVVICICYALFVTS